MIITLLFESLRQEAIARALRPRCDNSEDGGSEEAEQAAVLEQEPSEAPA
jgi:hypothetical protein